MTTATAEEPPTCSQIGCGLPATWRVTWIGRSSEPSFACDECMRRMRRTSISLRVPFKVDPLPKDPR